MDHMPATRGIFQESTEHPMGATANLKEEPYGPPTTPRGTRILQQKSSGGGHELDLEMAAGIQ